MNKPIPVHSKRLLAGTPIALFDFETTWEGDDDPGVFASTFHLREHWTVEIAVVHFDLGVTEPELVFETVVNPGRPIREEATAIHGIDNARVVRAPTFADIVDDLEDVLDGRLLAAYNLPFDWRVYACELRRLGREPPPFGGLDPLVWARSVHKYQKGHRLRDTARRYGVPYRPHEAGSDCTAAGIVMPILLRDLVAEEHCTTGDLLTVDDAYSTTRRLGIEWEEQLCEYHARRNSPKPFCYWRELAQ